MMGPPITGSPDRMRAAFAKVPMYTEEGARKARAESATRRGMTLAEYEKWLMETDIDTGSVGPRGDEDI